MFRCESLQHCAERHERGCASGVFVVFFCCKVDCEAKEKVSSQMLWQNASLQHLKYS